MQNPLPLLRMLHDKKIDDDDIHRNILATECLIELPYNLVFGKDLKEETEY